MVPGHIPKEDCREEMVRVPLGRVCWRTQKGSWVRVVLSGVDIFAVSGGSVLELKLKMMCWFVNVAGY